MPSSGINKNSSYIHCNLAQARAAEYGERWDHCSQEISEEKHLCQEIPVEKQF